MVPNSSISLSVLELLEVGNTTAAERLADASIAKDNESTARPRVCSTSGGRSKGEGNRLRARSNKDSMTDATTSCVGSRKR